MPGFVSYRERSWEHMGIDRTSSNIGTQTFISHFVAIIARKTVSGVEVTGGVEGRNIPTTTPVHT